RAVGEAVPRPARHGRRARPRDARRRRRNAVRPDLRDSGFRRGLVAGLLGDDLRDLVRRDLLRVVVHGDALVRRLHVDLVDRVDRGERRLHLLATPLAVHPLDVERRGLQRLGGGLLGGRLLGAFVVPVAGLGRNGVERGERERG